MSSILLVEDDQTLGQTLSERLLKEKYDVVWRSTKREALQIIAERQIDLCLIDIGLPDGSGLDLARDIRLDKQVPIMFLTAMNSADFRLEGFELGASDFIPKPFFLKELLLRIQNVLQRAPGRGQGTMQVGRTQIDFESGALKFADGSAEYPGAKDFALLRYLICAAPAPVNREEILQSIWKEEEAANPRTVDNAILRLRQLLKRGDADLIRSVRGIGYQWTGG
ncbi:MAG: response regulator transcription factor [Oligoflexia bacterium]|nr:response regulator transcription factor [Oligoflexia bacterium]